MLLSGSAYNGGSTVAMDPFHSATPALNDLRFASGSGSESDIESAVAKTVDAIHQHGVPNQIDGVSSIGDRAERFDPVELVGAMPHLTEAMGWQERAEAAHTMMAAQVAIPQNTPDNIRDEIREFTAQLARPSVDLADLVSRQEDVIADLSWWKHEVAEDVGAAAPAPASPPASSVPSSQPTHPDRLSAQRRSRPRTMTQLMPWTIQMLWCTDQAATAARRSGQGFSPINNNDQFDPKRRRADEKRTSIHGTQGPVPGQPPDPRGRAGY